MLNKLIICIFLIQNCFGMIIFPFKTVIFNNNDEVNQDNIEYNTTHYVNDSFYQPSYITLKIGNPPQDLKALLSYKECGFQIGKSNKCIYKEEFLSHYNRNSSSDFKYTDYFNKSTYEFKNGKSAEDSIYAYTDLSLKQLKKLENIGFYLGTDTNDELCAIIGFNSNNFKLYCDEVNNIFDSFKLTEMTNNDNWIIKYNSENEGLLIFDPDLKQIIKNYDSNKLFVFSIEKPSSSDVWTILIDKIYSENNNQTINKKELYASIDNDFGLIEGSGDYYYYITTTYFQDYIKKRICYLNDVHVSAYYYFAIECDKEKFGIDDMKNFPILTLVSMKYQKEFTFDYKDLFTEKKYKYFFNVIFNVYITERWIFGKIFLRKYPLILNYKLKTIAYYNEEFKIEPDTTYEEDTYGSRTFFSEKFLYFIIGIIFLLIIVSGVTCYFIGKYFNKIKRKKRANELIDDDFDYSSSKDNEKNLFDEKNSEKTIN